MALVETEGLVLKSYNLAEADKIVVLLTHDHGVVRGVAKGAKRLKSKFGSGLEPFSIVRVTYFQKEVQELVSIQNIDLERSYFAAASDPDFLDKFSYLADLLISFSPPHDPNETLYRMVKACLDSAEQSPKSLSAIGVYFELWLLRLGGYLPDWSNCDRCKRILDETDSASVQGNFHIVCGKCRRSSGTQAADATHRRIFAAARRLSPSDFAILTDGNQKELVNLSLILKRIISQAIGREVVGERVFARYNSL